MLKGITPQIIAQVTQGKYVGGEKDKTALVSSVETDSRKCTQGCLFVAIKGERTDGHDYVNAAFEKGAVCALAEKELPEGCTYVLVDNTVRALQRLAAYYRQSLGVKIVGITGSVGKTTCKEVVFSVLSQKYNVLKTLGNFNNEIGLPLTLLRMSEETEIGVIEMGMSDYGEMSLLSSIAKPDACIITNIGHSHMENLGSQEGILKAKSEIFDYMSPDAPAFLNGDDKLLRTVRRPNIHYFAVDSSKAYGEGDVFSQSMELKGFEGSSGELVAYGKKLSYEISIPGKHVIYAVLAAVGVGLYMGLTEQEVCRGLKAASTIDGRVNVICCGDLKIIDDCYNAAPDSMKAGLVLLTSATQKNTAAILGDMGELGADAPRLHREVGEFAAECGVETVVCIGALAKNIYQGCKDRGGRPLYFATKEEFISKAQNIIPSESTVLVKASHFMNFSQIVEFFKSKM